MSMRAALDAAYMQRARHADEIDRVAVQVIAAVGGDVSKHQSVRVQLDRDLGLIQEPGVLPDLVVIREHKTLGDLAQSLGVA